eukprot:CAMPEP_0119554018 /NCGR_PEP_ID=MMETSP1352-20130426/6615_1 /TAXON_ID=265584 /ORGANISM="Stauroneis constricta, Strain CCMP1120" /LENGTH=80 /DNA_ID=CAMNT_0007600531 /DNA_START=65 /DNA_END=307 /DNA_ORIENTATION=-
MAASYESTQYDMKSLLLNLASILLFVLPFSLYFYPENNTIAFGVVAGAFLIGYVAPPLGWKRPHPYSDNPNNLPYPRKEQ